MECMKNYTLSLQLFLKNGIFEFTMLVRECSKHVHTNLIPPSRKSKRQYNCTNVTIPDFSIQDEQNFSS
jgi:hypothetical protein